MRGKYLFQNRLALWVFRGIDIFLSIWTFSKKKNFSVMAPRKILLSNIAHLGDVILLTSVVALIKKQYPHIQIGVVVGSWAESIVKDHPLIDFVHLLDHWKVNRSNLSWIQKFKKSRSMSCTLVQELKKIGYDASVECNFHFPSTIVAGYRAKIPIRMGYTSGGLGPLLTHPVHWEEKNQSAALYAVSLVEKLLPLEKTELKPVLKSGKSGVVLPKEYIVIHMGSGNPIKEWPLESWQELCKQLTHEGHVLVFTGKGAKEKAAIEFVMKNLAQCIDLSDRLVWDEMSSIVQKARLLVAVDTAVAHLAAATDTQSVILFTGIHPLQLWAPLSSKAHLLVSHVPCHPCHRGGGCSTMACIKKISVEEVLIRIQSVLKN